MLKPSFNCAARKAPLIDPFWLVVWAVAIDDDRQREQKRREWLEFIAPPRRPGAGL